MQKVELLLLVGALYHIGFFIFHLGFWKLFNWPSQLKGLNYINRQVMQILNCCLMFVFLMFAWVSFAYPKDLTTISLGHGLIAVISGFWLFRTVLQIYYFGIKNLISIAFCLVFLVGALLYACIYVLS